MEARVSTANQRATTGDRKAVFKSVLDNPFKVRWPQVPHNVQNATLDTLVTILADVGTYHLERRSGARKRRRSRHKERKEKAVASKKRKVGDDGKAAAVDNGDLAAAPDTNEEMDAAIDVDVEPDVGLPEVPSLIAHLTIGINEVTKRLESQARSRRLRASIRAPVSSEAFPSTSEPKPQRAPLVYVFVCRADIDPPLLVAHLPELVASCNTPIPGRTSTPIHLISLPKQAEATLAETVGLRRVSVLALDSETPSLATLSALLASIQPPSVAWLTRPALQPSVSHIPTHIKQLRTTVPLDMRTAKKARTEGRQAAKAKGKTKSGNKIKEANKNDVTKPQTNPKAKPKANAKVKMTRRLKTRTKVKVPPPKKIIKAVSSTIGATQDLLPT